MKIKKFENYNQKKYGVLMVYFDIEEWKDMIESIIDKDDIYIAPDDDYGFEYNPHCTIIYGLEDYDDIIRDIHKFIEYLNENYFDTNNISIFRSNISIFENNDYDVVKFDIESEDLIELNELFRQNFVYNNEYTEYKPHMTIAYVKKGKGRKYIKKMEPVNLDIDKYVYSVPNSKKTTIT